MTTLLFTLLVWGTTAGADQVHDYFDGTNPSGNSGTAISAAIMQAMKLADDPKKMPTAISGVCDYKGTTCPGAKVNLYDGPDLVQSVTIDSSGVFRFHDLKDYFHYNIEVDYDRYHVKKKVTGIHPGKDPVRIKVE